MVLAYFVGAGLPAPQVSKLVAFDTITSLISASSPSLTQNIVSVSVDSILCRAYRGIRIVDSFAWARLNERGESVNEQVYWPEIPPDTLQAVASFQNMLADPQRRNAYIARLPAGAETGELVVHHTSGGEADFKAAPYFDVNFSGAMVHFDANGSAHVLPAPDGACP